MGEEENADGCEEEEMRRDWIKDRSSHGRMKQEKRVGFRSEEMKMYGTTSSVYKCVRIKNVKLSVLSSMR